MTSGTLRHSDKFQLAFRELSRSTTFDSSLRDLSRYLGHCVWTCYARSVPLCLYPSIISTLREIHLLITRSVKWDAPSRLSVTRLLSETNELVSQSSVAFAMPSVSAGLWLEAYSDAAVDEHGATWAFVSGDHVSQGTFEFTSHIFIHELLAASLALLAAAQQQPNGQTVLFVDN